MEFQFSNLLGAPYRGGNLCLHGEELFAPIGNKVSQVHLTQSTSCVLPFENSRQVRTICVSPNGSLLLSVDVDGRALLSNIKRRVVLHRMAFKSPVAAAKFSPDEKYLAVVFGKLLQVWHAPGTSKEATLMQLHRTYGGCHADVTSLDWSACSKFIAVGSKDLTARVFSLETIDGYKPFTLAGHKEPVLGVFFTDFGPLDTTRLVTISKDGSVFKWRYEKEIGSGGEGIENVEGQEVREAMPAFAGGKWVLGSKHYFNQRGARVSALAYHPGTKLLVAGFTSGVFDLVQMPDFTVVHALSISRERITSAAFNSTGAWLALGCAKLGQLLVWEWKSESYVLKQQGHYFDIAACDFSPDGAYIATGADDCKVKVWNMHSGFCFVTFSEHSAPVVAVKWLPSGHALVSASLDGTIRAFDLVRYRNFRTMTSPEPVQFSSLAIDPAGEIICAGSMDTFQVFTWSLKTGRLLEVLAGHEGPVAGLAFNPDLPFLASASWDKTVRTWDVFGGKGSVETLQHSHDVLALAFRPDGKQLASSTLDAQIHLWDPAEGRLLGTIEGRRDIAGGRLTTDRKSAGNLASGQCFNSLAYSADGSYLIAGGNSKYVCMYDCVELVMLRRFQITHNMSLDGVLDKLNSRNVTDAGPLDLINHDDDDPDVELLPPTLPGGVAAQGDLPGAGGLQKKKPVARTRCVSLSPNGRSWAAGTTEGLLIYSQDNSFFFDPTDLTEDVTPQAVHSALQKGGYLKALLLALRLNDSALVQFAVLHCPPVEVERVARDVPPQRVASLLTSLGELLEKSPYLDVVLSWIQALCTQHGAELKESAAVAMPTLRSLMEAVGRIHEDIAELADDNLFHLDFIATSAECKKRKVVQMAASAGEQ